MSHYEWHEPTYYCGDGYSSGPLLEADVAEGVRAHLYADYQDGVQVTLTVSGEGVRGVMGNRASTARSQDWPEVERFIPREEWPEEIYAGLRGPVERTPDPAVATAIAEFTAEYEDALDEAEQDD